MPGGSHAGRGMWKALTTAAPRRPHAGAGPDSWSGRGRLVEGTVREHAVL